jgi:predicted alpha/beta hydrolase family esterase
MLERSLGPHYLVKAPHMSKPARPHYRTWAQRIAELIAGTTNPVLVGHSFGASVLLKYLTEAAPLPSFTGLFLVATPFWGPDFPEFALPDDFATRLRDIGPIHLYHSRDDSEVPFEHLERYRLALPQAIVRELDGRGHEFNDETFPELADDIRAVVEGGQKQR